MLHEAMQYVDPVTGHPRGFLRISARPLLDSVLLTLDIRSNKWQAAHEFVRTTAPQMLQVGRPWVAKQLSLQEWNATVGAPRPCCSQTDIWPVHLLHMLCPTGAVLPPRLHRGLSPHRPGHRPALGQL
jgi:hypothetical protein